MGIRFSPNHMFQYQTIADLVAAIDAHEAAQQEAALQLT
jgi:hypothetical protein